MRIRTWIKKTKAGRFFWRVAIGIVGGTVTVLGAIALVAPGPGVLIVIAGLGILATEFAWASRAILKTKTIAATAAEKVGIPLWMKYMIAAICTAISIILIAYHFA